MNLTEEQLREFTGLLQKEVESIQAQLGKLGKDADFGDDADSMEEESDETEELSNRLGIEKVLKDRLSEVQEALARVADGSYGTCKQCGASLTQEMLRLNPESSLCRECKTAQS